MIENDTGAIIETDNGIDFHQVVCSTEPNEFTNANNDNLDGDEDLLDNIDQPVVAKANTPTRHERLSFHSRQKVNQLTKQEEIKKQ